MTAPVENPHLAGSSAPMDRDPAESGAGMPAAADRHPDGKSHQGDGRGKSKRKRRKRRGPVYAPGTGPRAPARPEPAVLVAPAPEVPIPPPKPSANGAARPADFYGALDLGTNNCRLLVAVPRDHGFRVVDAFSRIVRLGEGIGQTGRLGEAAMGRAIEALKVCGQKLAYRDVGRTRMIATEACRIAANGSDFVSRVRDETGLELEIVSRETEARLAVAGCASLVDPNAGGVILFDIGGGSSELVWLDLAGAAGDGRRRRMSDRIREWVSLPVGVVSLSERHGGRDVTPVQFEAMVAEVAVMLGAFPNVAVLDAAVAAGEVHMLGTSGTVTTLAGVHLDLPRYDRRVVDGTWLSGNQVAELVTLFMGMDYEARCANPCIGRERADLVLAGCAILEAIRRRWPCDRLRVADRGLREGVLVELMAEDGVWRPRSGRRAEDAHHA
ncbi:Ppx/GppA phosphatase family protein [Bosea sp. (in: a-proteobacteria)]|uniref:Ppx/GppA phosphatase family protein n=1 Tax=Bosea sp. (in: a-proteobacteria) TaxID=1871050 RepID=UPI0039C888DF